MIPVENGMRLAGYITIAEAGSGFMSTVTHTRIFPMNSMNMDVSSKMESYLNKLMDACEAQLTCNICGDLMGDAVTIYCGHTFCSICIQDWFRTRESCPSCRTICIGDEVSDSVHPIREYLSVLKPLVFARDKKQYHMLKRKATIRLTPTTSAESFVEEAESSGSFLKNRRDNKVEAYLMERLLTSVAAPPKELRSLEVSLSLVKCALADPNLNHDEFLQDLESLDENPIPVFQKYLTHSSLSHADYQYVPKLRKSRLVLEAPTRRSWVQMGVVFLIGVASYFILETLEEEGWSGISEPLLRAIYLFQVYLDVIIRFY